MLLNETKRIFLCVLDFFSIYLQKVYEFSFWEEMWRCDSKKWSIDYIANCNDIEERFRGKIVRIILTMQSVFFNWFEVFSETKENGLSMNNQWERKKDFVCCSSKCWDLNIKLLFRNTQTVHPICRLFCKRLKNK